MSVETEVKIRLAGLDDFRRCLARLNPLMKADRHFEDNLLLDFPDGRLRSQGCLLRVRTEAEGALLTFKSPAEISDLFKIREELEIEVGNGAMAVEIFERLGLKVWFRYQKYRTEYAARAGSRKDQELHIALDETPIGIYAEFEGSQEGIREAAGRMDFDESRFLRDSYYELYLQHCHRSGLWPTHMVFREK